MINPCGLFNRTNLSIYIYIGDIEVGWVSWQITTFDQMVFYAKSIGSLLWLYIYIRSEFENILSWIVHEYTCLIVKAFTQFIQTERERFSKQNSVVKE